MNEKTDSVIEHKQRRQRPVVEVLCALCGKPFFRQAHHHKYAVEHDQKEFCGSVCRIQSQTTSVNMQCAFCSKTVVVQKNTFKFSKSKHFFCGSACAASYNNKQRGPRSIATRNKIKESLNTRYLNSGTSRKSLCPVCDREFHLSSRRGICCSRKCGTIYKFGFSPCSKEDVVNAIVNAFRATGRTPMKRELNRGVNHAAVRFFGSWNKAIENCGLKPNENSPRNIRIRCSDGHIVRSISEKVIDEWLTRKNLKHEIDKLYPTGKYTCDFCLPDYNLWIEYFGLAGAFEEYDEAMRVKTEIAKEHGLNLVSLFPKDLYPECQLQEKLNIPLDHPPSSVL